MEEDLRGGAGHKYHRGCKIRAPPIWKGGMFALVMAAVWFTMIFSFALYSPEVQPRELALEVVAEDLNFPIQFDIASDGRIFFNEFVTGNVRVIQDGVLLEEPFVRLDVFAEGGASGLIGIAIQEPYVYIYYTYSRLSGEATCIKPPPIPICIEKLVVTNRVSRLPMTGDLAYVEEVILDYLPAGKNPDGGWDHFGGILRFGPDGKLYISVGDSVDPWAAQDMARLNGKILRINPDGSIPDDNPFPGSPIYLLGVRNVFGMDFLLDTLYFTDNGEVDHDEMNIGVAGGNYGWPYRVGNQSFSFDDTQPPDILPLFIDPLIDFTPAIAPTGMAYYDGDKLGGRPYTRVIFFGAFLHRNLTALRYDSTPVQQWRAEPVLLLDITILSMLNGPDGYLYISTFDSIHRVVLK